MSKKGLIARASALLLLPAAFAATAFTAVGCGDDAKLPDAGIDAPPPAPAALSMTPQTGDFGTVTVGNTSAALSFTVSNTGGSPSGSISAIASGANASDFAVQTTCTTLAAMGTCVVTVTFTAGTPPGVKAANLVVSGSPGGTVMATLAAVSQQQGTLAIAPSTFSFPDQVVNTTGATTQAFTVTNGGGAVTGTISVTPAGADPSQFIKSADTCNGNTLAAAATCSFTIAFRPSTRGAKSASYAVHANPGGDVTASVNGNGANPASIQIAPGVQDFGSVTTASSSANVTFAVSNTGDIASGALTAPALGGANAADFTLVSQNCSALVLTPNSGNTCNIIVKFSPLTAGSKSATVATTGAPGGTATASLTGAANLPGSITITPSTFAYMNTNVGSTSASTTYTVSNTGGAPTAPLATALAGANPGDFTIVAGSNQCQGTSLAALTGMCTIAVTFTPGSAGAKAASLSVSNGGQNISASLTGTGIVPAGLTIAPVSKDYGSVTVNTAGGSQIFTVKNTGGVASSVPTVALNGTNATEFTLVPGGCPAALPANGTCTITVSFNPTTVGAKSASLDVAVTGSAVSAPLTGSGISMAQLAANPSTLTFIGPDGPNADNQLIGTSSGSQAFTVINNGATTTGAITVVSSSPDFTQTNNCVAPLANGQTCSVTVTFSPLTTGHRTGSINVSAAPGGMVGVAVAGDALPRLQVIAPAVSPFDFGTVSTSVATPPCQVLTIRNNSQQSTATVTATATGFLNNTAGAPYLLFDDTACATGSSVTPAGGTGTVNSGCGGGTTLLSQAAFGGLGTTCSMSVQFKPTTASTSNANVTFSSGVGPTNNPSQDFTGKGNTMALTITPNPGNLGVVATGQVKTITLTVTNQSGSAAGALGAQMSGANATLFHITSDMCSGAGLAINATCTIVVTYFQPVGGGVAAPTATIKVTDSTGAVGFATDVLNVTAAGAATIQIGGVTNPPVSNFGNVFSGEATTVTYVVNNGGTINTGAITTTLAGDPAYTILTGVAGDCASGTTVLGAPAPAVAMCNVRVRFAPTGGAFGSKLATLTVTGNPGGTVVQQIKGAAVSAIQLLTDGSDFGTATIGGVAAGAPPPSIKAGFLVKNVSNSAVNFTSLTTNSAEFVASVDPGDCGASIPAMMQCTMHVTFTPAGLSGPRGDKTCDATFKNSGTGATVCKSNNGANAPSASAVVFTATSNNGTGTIFVIGNAVSKAALQITPTTAVFGSFAAPANPAPDANRQLTFTITNLSTGQTTGNATAGLASATNFAIVAGGGTCASPFTLAAGASCTVVVQFNPQSTGAQATTLSASTAAGVAGGVSNSVALSGTGQVAAPDVAVTPTAFDFGTKAIGTSSAVKTFSFHNNTAVTQGFTLAVPADYAIDAATTTCLPAVGLVLNGTCAVGVKFSPVAPAGLKTGSLTMTLTGPSVQGSVTAGLQGTGINAMSLTGLADHTFPDTVILVAQSSFQYTLTNNGAGPIGPIDLTIRMGAPNNVDFNINGGTCEPGGSGSPTVTLAPLQSCTFTANFRPILSVGPESTPLDLTANGLLETAILSGTARNLPSLSIAPTTSQDDGSRQIGKIDAAGTVFTITNGPTSDDTGALVLNLPKASDASFVYTAVANGCALPDPITGAQPAVPTRLGPGGSCAISILYNPIGNAGGANGTGANSTTVTIQASRPALQGTVNATVTGTSTETITTPAGPVHLGNGSAPVDIVFTNNASVATDVLVTDMTTLGAQVSVLNDTCSAASIAAGGTCTVKVRFISNGSGFTSTTFTLAGTVQMTAPTFGANTSHTTTIVNTLVP